MQLNSTHLKFQFRLVHFCCFVHA